MSSFFRRRSPEEIEQEREAFANREPRLPKEIAQDEENEALIRSEHDDVQAGRLLALARLLDPAGWESRNNFLDMIEKERNGRRANEPAGRSVIASYTRAASFSIAPSISKARKVIALVQSWTSNQGDGT